MSKIFLFVILAIFIVSNSAHPETGKCYIAVSSDSELIYTLDLLNYRWVLDQRWQKGKYRSPCISPRGRYLAFEKYSKRGFCIIDSKSTKIVDNNIDIGIDLFSWSPNEKFLSFLGRSFKYNEGKIGIIYLYNLETKLLRKIYSFASCFDYPSPAAWNASGDKLYFINKDNMVIEFDIKKNITREIVKGKEAHWISELELLIRRENDKYYLYNLQSREEKYLFKLETWQYPPISLSPDKKIFLCWDTKPRRLEFHEQWFTAIREFPSGKTLKVMSNKGANLFSWYCVP